MCLHPQPPYQVPEETARVAHAAFPNPTLAMQVYDTLGCCYADDDFADLFPSRGQPAASPSKLALVLLLQFAENLTDRQAADAVRGRIDWKYALGLALTDPGFHFSLLSAFRDRLIAGDASTRILDRLLIHAKERGWLKERGRQRTDSTHILAAVRSLHRLECVGRTLQHTLNMIAQTAPDWLRTQTPPEWFERYRRLIDEYRLPKSEPRRHALAEQIGADGLHLLALLDQEDAPSHVRELDAVACLRRVWTQQFETLTPTQLRWRTVEELPPSHQRLASPHDQEARYSTKRSVTWVGYKVHLTETCDPETPNLITHVETTPSTDDDSTAMTAIHQGLERKQLLPREHLVDTGYTSGELITTSKETYGITIVGPVPPDTSWQARDGHGFAITAFTLDWEQQQATCPAGKHSAHWTAQQGPRGKPTIQVHFRPRDCRACQLRERCTKNKAGPRELTLHPRAVHEALQTARTEQETDQFKQCYAKRSGVEGTISQTVVSLGMRRSRYVGMAPTHLHHVLTATAANLIRLAHWWHEQPRAATRRSAFAALAPA